MNVKERIMAALRREELDIIPFTMLIQSSHITGLAFFKPWRHLLDNGLGIHAAGAARTYKVICSHASMDITHHYGKDTSWSLVDLYNIMDIPHDVKGIINTPVGNLSMTTHWKSLDLTMVPWFQEGDHVIENLDDFEVVKYIIEDAEYTPNYEGLTESQMIIGNSGIISASVPKSPFQAMIMMMGTRKLALNLYMHRKEFDDLYRIIYKKELEICKIVAESPIEVVWGVDNITSLVTSPKFFEKYNLPFYNEVADIFHKQDKIYVVHMDGELKNLLDLIARTRIDVIESFTPPPIGDLPIEKAKEAWKNKVIWANFPESISLQGRTAIRKKTREMLKSAAPGNNFLMGIAEDFPSFMHLLTSVPTILKTVMKYGKYPIPKV